MDKNPSKFLFTGPVGAGKSARCFNLLREFRRARPLLPALVLLPSHSAARAWKRKYLQSHPGQGLFNVEISSFGRWIKNLLSRQSPDSRLLSEAERDLTLRVVMGKLLRRGVLKVTRSEAEFTGIRRFVADLKRAETQPQDFAFALRNSGIHGRERKRLEDISQIYSAYQKYLQTNFWYDGQGAFWQASICLRESAPPEGFPNFVIAEAFTDFSKSQFEILQTLFERADAGAMSFCETFAMREAKDGALALRQEFQTELFATLEKIRADFPLKEIQIFTQSPAQDSPFLPLADALFARDTMMPPAPAVRCLGLPKGLANQMRALASEIRTMLDRGVLGREILVAGLNPDLWSDVFISALEDFGVQRAPEPPKGKREYSVCLRRFLAMLGSDFQLEDIVSFLKSKPRRLDSFLCSGNEADTLDILLRRLGWTSGFKAMLKKLESELRFPFRRFEDEEYALLRRFHRQFKSFETLLKSPVTRWIDLLELLMELLDQSKGVDEDNEEDFQQCRVALLSAKTLFIKGKAHQEFSESPLADSPSVFSLASGLLEFPKPSPASAIAFCDLKDVKFLRADHLFLVNADASVLPGAEPLALLDSGDINRLRGGGLRFPPPSQYLRGVLCDVYFLLAHARKSLTCLYSSSDLEGRPKSPSPILLELPISRDKPGENFIPRRLLMNRAFHSQSAANQLDVEEGAKIKQAGQKAQWNERRLSPLADKVPQAFRASIQAHDLLSEFHSENKIFSSGQFSDYAICPFRYYCSKILRLSPLPEVDMFFSALDRGNLMHQTLQRFFRRALEQGAEFRQANAGDLETLLRDVYLELTERYESALWDSAVWPHEKEEYWTTLKEFLRVEIKEFEASEGRKPWAFEWSFGRKPDDDRDPLSKEETFGMKRGGEILQISGSIDRVDRIYDSKLGEGFEILDYKSGSTPKAKSISKGVELQLPLYALFLAGQISDEPIHFIRTAYYSLSGLKREAKINWPFKSSSADSEAKELKTLEDVKRRIWELADGINRGDFSVYPEHGCPPHCAYRSVCRYRESLELPPKTRELPRKI